MRGNKIEFYGPEGICLAERLRKPISKHDFSFTGVNSQIHMRY